jgi:hypothetical protein
MLEQATPRCMKTIRICGYVLVCASVSVCVRAFVCVCVSHKARAVADRILLQHALRPPSPPMRPHRTAAPSQRLRMRMRWCSRLWVDPGKRE